MIDTLKTYAASIGIGVLCLFCFLAGWTASGWRLKAGIEKERAALAKARADEQQEQARVSARTVTAYVDRVKIVTVKGEDRVKEIPVYVPAVMLPGSFRVFHDAAAGDSVPSAASIADAPAVDAQTAAAAINANYTACHANAEQLRQLQAWARGVAADPAGLF